MSLSLEFKQEYLTTVAPMLKQHYSNLLMCEVIDRAFDRPSLDKCTKYFVPMLLTESKKKSVKHIPSPIQNVWFDYEKEDWVIPLHEEEDKQREDKNK